MSGLAAVPFCLACRCSYVKSQRLTNPLQHAKCFVQASPLLSEAFLAPRISICNDMISCIDRLFSSQSFTVSGQLRTGDHDSQKEV